MATIEEQFVGYQIVKRLNQVQEATLSVAGKLKAAKGDLEADSIKQEAAGVVDQNAAILSKVTDFIAKYPGGASALAKGYQAMGVTAKQVSDEKANLVTAQESAKSALSAASAGKDAAAAIGNDMNGSVAGHITEIVDFELHFELIQMHCCCWDLVNVMAIVLQGINPGSGKPLENDSVDLRKAIIRRHLKTFSRASPYLDYSDEAVSFVDAVKIVTDMLDTCNTVEKLSVVGELVDVRVPRLPLVRRLWQYDGEVKRNNPGP